MSVTGFDFAERDLFPVLEQSIDDPFGLTGRKEPVTGKGDDQKSGFDLFQSFDKIASGSGGQIEIVRGTGDVEVTVGIKTLYKTAALILQITLNGEVKVEIIIV